MKTAVITGATSMIGTSIVDACLANGINTIYAVVREGTVKLSHIPDDERIKLIYCNADDYASLPQKISEKCDGIVITEKVFENDAVIIPSPEFDSVTLLTAKGIPTVRMTFGNVPYLLIWAKPGAPFVCVEPWHGLPDNAGEVCNISEKKGMIHLSAGETFTFETTAEFL